jgi:hypothetical protein
MASQFGNVCEVHHRSLFTWPGRECFLCGETIQLLPPHQESHQVFLAMVLGNVSRRRVRYLIIRFVLLGTAAVAFFGSVGVSEADFNPLCLEEFQSFQCAQDTTATDY